MMNNINTSTGTKIIPTEDTGRSAKAALQHPESMIKKTDWRKIFSLREMGVYYGLLSLFVILSFTTWYLGKMNYLSMVNMTNVLYQSSLVGLMAVAMTVLLISGNFDLSVASVAALSGIVFIGFADRLGFWPSASLAMVVAISAGLLNGSITQFVGINAFIVTLGTMTGLRGLILIFTEGHSVSVGNLDVINMMKLVETGRIEVGLLFLALGFILIVYSILRFILERKRQKTISPSVIGMSLGGIFLLTVVYLAGGKISVQKPVIYMAIYTGLIWFVLTYTVIGRRLYAVGGNAEAARLSGINVLRYKLMAFVLCSGTAGVAGILFGCRLRSMNPAALSGTELTVIASAILGGTSLFGGAGSVLKTLAGALLLYSLTNGFNILNLGANFQPLLEGIVVIVAASIYTVGIKRS